MGQFDDFQFTGRYLGGLRTYALHKQSGDVLKTDAPRDNEGEGQHFSPTDVFATSLGACIMTIMGIKARNEKINIEGASFDVKKVMASNPRRIGSIEIVITMPNHEYTDREKRSLEAAAHHCPVGNSLHPDIDEVITIVWPED